jgi:FkbM family methyltransferase
MPPITEHIKRLILGSPAAGLIQEHAHRSALRKLDVHNPEQAQIVANGIIADRLIVNLNRPESAFLDVGAHIGSVFSSVHAANRSVKIIAIEAHLEKAAALQRSYSYALVLPYAVGERSGTSQFFQSTETAYNSLVGTSGASVSVQVCTLDELLPDQHVDVIKIDIEGAELGAFRGGEGLIQRSRPTIMFESVGTELNSLGYSPALLWQWLDERDFLVFTPDRVAHDAPAMDIAAFLDAHEYPFRTHKYFAIPRERRTEVRDIARSCLRVV